MLMQNCLRAFGRGGGGGGGGKKHANKMHYGGCGNGLEVLSQDEDNAYAKLFACVGGQETRKQSVLWGMWKLEPLPGGICHVFNSTIC